MYSNPDLEKDVLIAFLLFPREYANYAKLLTQEDFTIPIHKKIFAAIKKLVDEGKEVNPLLMVQDIPDIDDFIANSPAPGVININDFIEELKQLRIKRQIEKLANEIKLALAKNVENERIIAGINKYIRDLDIGTDEIELIKDVVVRVIYDLEKQKNKPKIEIGISGINDMFEEGEMTVIGARPGVGKTAFALKIAYNLAKEGKNIYFVSREMTNEQITKRLLAKTARVDFNKIRKRELKEEDWKQLVEAMAELSQLNIYMDCKTSYVEDIYLKVATMKEIDCVIIDYLQLLKTREKTQTRDREIGEITRTLKIMNLDLNIPIFVLSQLNRDGEKEPTLRTLRESGNIEQDFDNVVFLHYSEKEQEKVQREDIKLIKLIVAKHRNGKLGKYNITFEPQFMEFYDEFK